MKCLNYILFYSKLFLPFKLTKIPLNLFSSPYAIGSEPKQPRTSSCAARAAMDPPKVIFPTYPLELLFPTDLAALDGVTPVVGPTPMATPEGPTPATCATPEGVTSAAGLPPWPPPRARPRPSAPPPLLPPMARVRPQPPPRARPRPPVSPLKARPQLLASALHSLSLGAEQRGSRGTTPTPALHSLPSGFLSLPMVVRGQRASSVIFFESLG
jgi:hypothetical protein